MNLKCRRQNGFILGEVLIVLVVIGLVYTSIFVLQQTLIKSVIRFSKKAENQIILNNAFYKVYPVLIKKVFEKEERIQKLIFDKSYKEKNISFRFSFREPKDSMLKNIKGLNLFSIELRRDYSDDKYTLSSEFIVSKKPEKTEKK